MSTTRRTPARRATAPSRTPARRAARATARASRSKVMIGRFGSEPATVQISGRSTVLDVLQKAGIELASAERVWLNGERSELMAAVKNNDTISIVSPKEAGKN